ncbi:MAG: Cys-Gln thioester bond-forming surface protein [Clostridiales Family XIII bacterium]|jgi:TQXA domain-containing protein|nr:Cys-Gln thioester bond-forming surface protein [Clostridiales Family XIII bacterium]
MTGPAIAKRKKRATASALIVALLAAAAVAAPLPVHAVGFGESSGVAWVQGDSMNTEYGIDSGARYAGGGHVAYCMDEGRAGPTGDYGNSYAADGTLAAVLYYGYPNNTVIQGYALTADQARCATQVAVWACNPERFDINDASLHGHGGYMPDSGNVLAAARALYAYALANGLPDFASAIEKPADKTVGPFSADYRRIGPYTVTGAASISAVLSDAPAGAYIGDAAGTPTGTYTNGGQFYAYLPVSGLGTQGTATINIYANYIVPSYTCYWRDGGYQRMVLVGDPYEANNSGADTLTWSVASVTKRQTGGDVPVPDTEFRLDRFISGAWQAAGEGTTDAAGKLVFPGLGAGTWRITETRPNPNYATGGESGQSPVRQFTLGDAATDEIQIFENDLIAVSVEVDKDTIQRTSAAYASLPGKEGFDNVGRELYRYDVDYRSTSSVRADELTVDDPLEAVSEGQIRLEKLWTPVSWGDTDGKMNIWYRTNLTDDGTVYDAACATDTNPENANNPGRTPVWPNTGYRLWARDVPTAQRTALDAASLGLAEGEYITAVRYEHGSAEKGFTTKNYADVSLNDIDYAAVAAGEASEDDFTVDWTPRESDIFFAAGALDATGLMPATYLVSAAAPAGAYAPELRTGERIAVSHAAPGKPVSETEVRETVVLKHRVNEIADKLSVDPVFEDDRAVSGKGTPGEPVRVMFPMPGPDVTAETVVSPDGAWRAVMPESYAPQPGDGIRAARDLAGTDTVAEERVCVTAGKRPAPETPGTFSVNPVREGDAAITGAGAPGATVTLTEPEAASAFGALSTTADAGGAWRIDLPEVVIASSVSAKIARNLILTDEDEDAVVTRLIDTFEAETKAAPLPAEEAVPIPDTKPVVVSQRSGMPPQTGDDARPVFFAVLLLVSAIAVLALAGFSCGRGRGRKKFFFAAAFLSFLFVCSLTFAGAGLLPEIRTQLAAPVLSLTAPDGESESASSRADKVVTVTREYFYTSLDAAPPVPPPEIEKDGKILKLRSVTSPIQVPYKPDARTYEDRFDAQLAPETYETAGKEAFPKVRRVDDGLYVGDIPLTEYHAEEVYVSKETERDEVVTMAALASNEADAIPQFRAFTVRDDADADARSVAVYERAGVRFDVESRDALGLPVSYAATVVYRGAERYLELDRHNAYLTYRDEIPAGVTGRKITATYQSEDVASAEDAAVSPADTDGKNGVNADGATADPESGAQPNIPLRALAFAGAGIAILALAAILILFLLRRHKKRRESNESAGQQ